MLRVHHDDNRNGTVYLSYHWFMHLSAAIPRRVTPGTYKDMARNLFTLVANFKPGTGGLDCFCTAVARSSGKDPRDSWCRRHIGDGARITADGCDRYCEMILIVLLGTFRSEYEYDYEYEFSVLSTCTLKNVDLET